jgi:hypothetical protein
MGTLPIAIAAAAAIAIFSFPFRLYQCWYSWNRLWTNLGLILYLAISGIGGGFIGWLTATLTSTLPTSFELVNGALFGIGGALILRADFRPLASLSSGPRQQAAPSKFVPLREATTALSASMNWVAALQDDVLARRAQRSLDASPDDALARQAYSIAAHIGNRTDCTQAAKNKMGEKLATAMETLQKQPDDREEARAQIIAFCARYITEQHLLKM